METIDNKSHQNYELLIRIDEQLKNFTREMRDSNAGFDRRIAVMESNKLSKEDANKMYLEAEKIHADHETRLRDVEEITKDISTKIKTWGSVAVIALGLLQIILKFIND